MKVLSLNRGSCPRRAIHLDFHTMPGIYDIGKEFKADEFARTLKQSGVDYITVFARCNLGFAYYPTRVGTIYPGLKKDLLGEMVTACHRYNIRVAAYINAGLDHEHALRHREWVRVSKDGRVYQLQTMGHWFRTMCLNTGYRRHLLALCKEVLTNYPVDGLFLDCFSILPCYGVECLEGMKKAGLDYMDEDQATEFCWMVTESFAEEVKRLVKKHQPGINIYFNGLPYRLQPTHLELEILPTGGWGYDALPFQARYARGLGKPFFTMTGRFHKSWGDFGGLRPTQALLFDCFLSLASGGSCSVGDHLHPRGKLEPEVYNLIGQVYGEISKYDEWTVGAVPVSDFVLLDPGLKRFPGNRKSFQHLSGFTRILRELHYHFDIGDDLTDINDYQGVILPDFVPVDEYLKTKLEQHLRRGGWIISSGESGLNPAKTDFALKEFGLNYLGPEEYHPTFFTVEKEISSGIPFMPIAIYHPGVAVRANPGTKILAQLWKAYSNQGYWDFFHEYLYNPPEKSTGRPALTRKGNIFHFSFPVGQAYFESAVPAYRSLVDNCLAQVLKTPLTRVENCPSFVHIAVTSQPKRRIVHLLTWLPELRGQNMQVIEQPMLVEDITVSLRRDQLDIKEVYLAPEKKPLAWEWKDDYVTVRPGRVKGYCAIVFET
ncbi:MAG: alpha-L-fucosidase [Candidatus Omnitrophica bacterium]|nr:alpha-L-fucosidase [Candidatus Omnitrophota bacterium]